MSWNWNQKFYSNSNFKGLVADYVLENFPARWDEGHNLLWMDGVAYEDEITFLSVELEPEEVNNILGKLWNDSLESEE